MQYALFCLHAYCAAGKAEDTLKDVMMRMSAAGIHHIYLCEPTGFLTRVVSLGDILAKFVSTVAHVDSLPTMMAQ